MGPLRGMITVVLAMLVVAYAVVPGVAVAGGDVVNAYTLTAVVSVVVLIVAVVTQRPRPLWPWLVVAASGVAWVAGDVVYDSLGTDPLLSVADPLYVLGYLGVAAAVRHVLRVRVRQHDVDNLLEAAMVGVVALLAVWVLVIEPVLREPGVTVLERLTVGLYPVLGAVVLFMLARMLLAPPPRPVSGLLLTAAMGATFVADSAYAVLQQTAAYEATTLPVLDAGWLALYALLAIAVLQPDMRELARPVPVADRLPGRLVATGATVLAVPAVYAAAVLLDLEPGVLAVVPAAVIIVPLVLLRFHRVRRELERSHDEVVASEAYYRSVATHASDVFVVVDRDGTVRDVFGALAGLTGTRPDALIGRPLASLMVEPDRELGLAVVREAVRRPETTAVGEVRVLDVERGWRWVAMRCTNLLDDPVVGGIVANVHDVSDRRAAEEQLAHLALHDPLTGLANRTLLKDRLGHALARRRRGGHDVAVLFCDLDGFKTVNDVLGHGAGDELLDVTAQRMVGAVRPGDTVARVGGDEFAVLLECDGRPGAEAMTIADRLQRVMSDPVTIGGTPMVVTASIGVAVAGHDSEVAPDDLLRDADTAMYGAKSAGRDQVVRYRPSMREAALLRMELETDLRGAVARDELVVHYQPMLALDGRRLVGFEALLRWQHPTRGLLPPGDFVQIAEQSGTIVEIGAWVLDTACRTAVAWTSRGDELTPTISVNLSGRQLSDPDLVTRVARALHESGLAPARLVLELTESVLVEQPELAAERLRELKSLGVRLAIDDFGVGYSSLSYLRQFPVDILKIDRSFTRMIESSDRLPALVHGLLDLGHLLDLETVAEGIENDAQLEALVREGCQLGQGFYFSRPVDEDTARRLAGRAGRAWRAAATEAVLE